MKKERELLFSVTKKDFKIDTFRCSGSGGQKVNKTSSGVRVTHPDSGAVGTACDTRSQHSNKDIAFTRCVKSEEFKRWHSRKCNELLGGETAEQKVERQMQPHLIKTEELRDDEWVEVK